MEKFCLKINSICKSFLQGVIASEMPKMLLFNHTAYIGTHFVFIHEFVVRVRQLPFRSSDGYSVVPASSGHRIDSCQSADTCSCIFSNWFGFWSNNNIWLVQCCAYHSKKFHHQCIQNHTCMYKILLCCYMLHRRRMLSLRDIRSRLNEIDMKFSTNRTQYLLVEITSGIFITFSHLTQRNNYSSLKKPT
jgi:hypothetical protein